MLKLFTFLVLSLFATYMDTAITIGKAKAKKVIPITNQLPS